MMKKIVVIIVAALVIAVAAMVYINTGAVTSVTVEETEPVYVIRFTDPDGNPVSGVMANVCDDTACTMLTADEDGVAHFSGERKAWSVQILKVPEGFTFAADEKIPLNETGETVIVLNRE